MSPASDGEKSWKDSTNGSDLKDRDHIGQIQTASLTTKQLYGPLFIASAYLSGTFGAFFLIGETKLVPDMSKLTVFVLATIVLFAGGYVLRMRSLPRRVKLSDPIFTEIQSAKLWIVLSAGYLAAFGVASLVSYGARDPEGVLAALVHPGAAYAAKFHVYDLQTATGERNSIIQILTILAVLGTPLAPLMIVYWRHLTVGTKLIAGLGVACYAAFFLFIGTLQGLGYLLIFACAGILVSALGTWHSGPNSEKRKKKKKKSRTALAVMLLTIFVGYMANNQSQRLTEFGIAGKIEPNPVVAAIVGDSFGRGLSAAGSYPTQGYLGLAYNLDTPFVWTRGLGSSRAIASYWDQYVGDSGTSELTYPARTEVRTGWPAGMYWATIYPWLASDLTFPGAALFMGVVGWLFAKFWYEAAFARSFLALLLFCQFALLLIFVPANNQIGLGRPSMFAFASLVVAYLFARRRTHGEPL